MWTMRATFRLPANCVRVLWGNMSVKRGSWFQINVCLFVGACGVMKRGDGVNQGK